MEAVRLIDIYPKPVSILPPLVIGGVVIDPPLILAPMAGITNHAFRTMVKESGCCGLVTSEMISGHALKFGHKGTKKMLDWTDEERPVSAQVFGSIPEIVAEGARMLAEAGADIIEINMGCPAPKVVKSGSGSALLKDLKKAEEMISATIKAAGNVPVMLKTRTGWDSSEETAITVAKMVEAHGGAAVTIHGRTAVQKFTGTADWDIIRRVKDSVSIPVIGNGDIKAPEDVKRMFDETGCDGVMIARAAVGNPWLISRAYAYLTTGIAPPDAGYQERIEASRRHARLLVDSVGERRGSQEMRGHIALYIKGTPGAARIRARIMTTNNLEEIEEVLDEASNQCEPGFFPGR